jgi:diaminopimelate epimerase
MSNKPLRAFLKMHGLGNDFVIFDARRMPLSLSPQEVSIIANRRTGIGCDQLITITSSANADAHMRIQNADGSEAEACGNATRCVAALVMEESAETRANIETNVGILECRQTSEGVRADLGIPQLEWPQIPLAEERDTLNLGLTVGALENPVGVNVGNPHAIFFVGDAETIDLNSLGPVVETYPLFPERINVGVAEVINKDDIRFRVWERGTGITMACGTGAAAAVVAGVRRGLVNRQCKVRLDGGQLMVHWHKENDHVTLSGPVELSFRGNLDLEKLRAKGQAA